MMIEVLIPVKGVQVLPYIHIWIIDNQRAEIVCRKCGMIRWRYENEPCIYWEKEEIK